MALLIQTKLHAPPLRQGLLARPRLLDRLRVGLQEPLTLIAAPAGYGKTTLALAGITAAGARVAWLSLDAGDNDSTRFLAYVLAALQAADLELAAALADLSNSSQPAPPELVLTEIINHIAATGVDVVLVLDDYHVIQHAAVHALVTFLLEHAPPQLHLLLTTRADPPLPLARLRARGQLVELRAADLRFTPAEAAAFFVTVMHLQLPGELAASLAERTEGWIVGLQLAALRLKQGAGEAEDAQAFVRAFAGTQRYILDYLLEEVLRSQPSAIQRFLLLTAPLARLCGPLCDAVLAAAGDLVPTPTLASAALLAELERANVLLVPLDEERHWYRYHHLFADLLRARLHEAHWALEGTLHSAAATWLEEHGFAAEAVDAALAAGDGQRAARLVEQNTVTLLAAGELGTLLGWIGALPPAVRRQRPALCIQQAYALAFAGQIGEAATALDLAEQGPLDEAQTGATIAVRAMLAVMAGNDASAVALAEVALARLPEEAHWDRATANWAAGYAQRDLGDLRAAQSCFAEQIRLARVLGNVWTLVTGLTDLALVLAAQGELPEARNLLEEALAAAANQGAASAGYTARTETALAGVLCWQGELDAAEKLLAAAFTHVGRWPNPNHIVYAHLVASRVQAARGDLAAARASLQQARAALATTPVTRTLQRQVEEAAARLGLDNAGDGAPPGQARAAVASAPAGRAGAPQALVEPLSARELEVLALLAQGLTNQAIAARLIVAPGTVKAHTAAIYRKLDVANRTEAAARARQLELV